MLYINRYLLIPDLLNLEQTSKQFNNTANDPSLWQPIAKHFQVYVEGDNVDYKGLVKKYTIPTTFKIPNTINLLSINDKGECCGSYEGYLIRGLLNDNIYKFCYLKGNGNIVCRIDNRSIITGGVVNYNCLKAAWWDSENNVHELSSMRHSLTCAVYANVNFVIRYIPTDMIHDILPIIWLKNNTNKYEILHKKITSNDLQNISLYAADEIGNRIVGAREHRDYRGASFYKSQAVVLNNQLKLTVLKSLKHDSNSLAWDINDDGAMIIGESNGSAVTWIQDNVTQCYKIHQLSVPTSIKIKHSEAKYISHDGQIIAGDITSYGCKSNAVLWINQHYTEFKIPSQLNVKFSQIVSMSRNGSNFIARTDDNEYYIIHQPRLDLTSQYFPMKTL